MKIRERITKRLIWNAIHLAMMAGLIATAIHFLSADNIGITNSNLYLPGIVKLENFDIERNATNDGLEIPGSITINQQGDNSDKGLIVEGTGGGTGRFYHTDSNTVAIQKSGNDRQIELLNNGTIQMNGYTKLGSDAPVIKMKKITGTMGVSEGDQIAIAHGLDYTKILGIQAMVTADNGSRICPGGINNIGGYAYDLWADTSGTDIFVRLHNTTSENITGNAITILITYEE